MQPEEELRADHMAIRRGLKTLERLTESLREGHPVRNTDLYTLVDVLRKAAVDDHQGKEERVLFSFLREHRDQFGIDGLRVFETEHDELDEMLVDIRGLVDTAADGDKRARQRIAKKTNQYAQATRDHFRKEEETFLDRLHENLTTDQIETLDDQLEAFDGQHNARDRLTGRIQKIENDYEERF